jgi:photosystem II stability/assembly factor-like uncharacterized protein
MVTLALSILLLMVPTSTQSDTTQQEWMIMDLPSSEQVKGIETCGDGIIIATGNDIYRSGSASFEPVIEGLRHKSVQDMLSHGDVWDVATSTGGIFRTTDRGLTWTARPLPDSSPNVLRLVRGITFDYALTSGGRMFVRRGAGGQWQSVAMPATLSNLRDLAIDGPRCLVVTDSGDVAALETTLRWTTIGRLPCRSNRPLITVNGADAVIVADSALYRYTRTAATPFVKIATLPGDRWSDVSVASGTAVLAGRPRELISVRLNNGDVQLLPIPGKADDRIGCIFWDGRTMLAGIDRGAGGLYVMPYGIREWRRIGMQSTKNTDVTVKRIVRSDAGVFACMQRDGIYAFDSTMRRVDQRHQGLRNTAVASLHRVQNTIIGCSRTFGGYRFDKCGATTSAITTTIPRGEGFAMTSVGSTIYVSSGRVGLWRSTDLGRRWTRMTYPDSTAFIDRLDALGMVLIASARQRSYSSSDNGKTWQRFRVATDTSLLRWVANGSGGSAMIGTADGAWLRSTTNAPWKRIETPYTMEIGHRFGNGVIVGTTIILGTKERLVVSRDHGATWTEMSIANAKYATYIAAAGGRLYVVTDGGKLLSKPFK